MVGDKNKNMKMRKKIISLLAIVASLSLGVGFASAQALPQNIDPKALQEEINRQISSRKNSEPKGIVLADVSLQNAKIISQDKNKLRIAFDIINGGNVQPDALVAVNLYSQDLKSIYDRKIVTEKLTLGEKGTIHKEIEYNAPDFLSGKYKLFLESKTSKSLPLASVSLGDITLSGSGKYLEIDQKSCYLTVDGENSNKRYTLDQGVDIKPEENLVGHCNVISHFDQAITYQPKFEVQQRGAFGDKVSVNMASTDPENIKAGEKKTVSYSIPKAERPQAYDAVLTLYSSDGKVVSSPVAFHYVIHGESATIQNIQLDKVSYAKGDTAKMTFFWTLSADSFYGSRLGATDLKNTKLGISIVDQNGQKCIDDFTKDIQPVGLSPLIQMEIPLTMKANCSNPEVGVKILGSSGQALDALSFPSGSDSGLTSPISSKEAFLNKISSSKRLIILIVILLFVISLLFIIRDKNRRRAMTVFVIMMSSMMFFQTASARTITFNIYDYYICDRGHDPNDIWHYENFLAGYPQCWNNAAMYNYYYRWYYDQGVGAYKVGCPYDSTAVGHCLSQFPIYEVGLSAQAVYAGQPLLATTTRTQNMLCQNGITGGGSADVFVDGVSPNNWHVDGLSDNAYSNSINLPTSASDVGNHTAIFLGNLASKNFSYWGAAQTRADFPYSVLSVPVVNGACGTANKTYAWDATGWGADTYCSSGNANSSPGFPAQGASVSWQCLGTNGGTNASCSASRGKEPCISQFTYSCTTTGGNCTADTCGQTVNKSSICTRTDTAHCVGSSVVAQSNCGSSCNDQPVQCPPCSKNWIERAP